MITFLFACQDAEPPGTVGPFSSTSPSGSSPTDPPPPLEVSGTLEGDTVWSPAEMAWVLVVGELVVPTAVTLTIEAGTDVRFASGASITVNGVLRATGSDSDRIRFRSDPLAAWEADFHPSLPDGPPHWGGIQFVGTWSEDNLVSYADVEGAQTESGSLGVIDAEAVLEHLTVTGTRLRSVYTEVASVIVRDSVFPTMFTDEDDPDVLGLDNDAEYVKGVGGIPTGGHYRIERNVFGVPKGHNDVLDVQGNRWPAEVLEVRGNTFEGGGDEGIDGGGDLLLDGNVFRSIAKDAFNHGSGDSNCLSTGDELSTLVVATRNVYVGVDHVANLKRASFGYFEHNTVVGISPSRSSAPGDNPPRTLLSSAIRLVIPDPLDPTGAPPRDTAGIGASLDGNLFVDVPEVVFGNPDDNGGLGPFVSWLAVEHTLVDRADVFANADGVHGRAFDFLVGEPAFVDAANGDYHLSAGSLGRGAGRGGLDIGYDVPYGAHACCLPADGLVGPDLVLDVGGPGLFSFEWSLDGGPWTDVTIASPLDYTTQPSVARTATLSWSDLSAGAHTLVLRGRDFAGTIEPDTSWPFTVVP